MKKSLIFLVVAIVLLNCIGKEKNELIDGKILLKTGKINSIAMKDTIIIVEDSCGGCPYKEGFGRFHIYDSMNIVKLDYITYVRDIDINPPRDHMELTLSPLKEGRTKIKVYQVWDITPKLEDSMFVPYDIEIKK